MGSSFVVSLDFELYWGVRDKVPLERYRERLLGARAAVPRLLELFSRHGIHATWATVGFLFCESKEELLASLPATRPSYSEAAFNPYRELDAVGADEEDDPYHYAPSLIARIAATPGQELASHTFSHYYCLEAGQTREAFSADLEAARAVAGRRGHELRSLVFPRNQYAPEHLAACAAAGFAATRGNQAGWMYRPARSGAESPPRRLARLADAYLPLTGNRGAVAPRAADRPANVPATAFLRPVTPALAPFEQLRARRLRRAMTAAARSGGLFHLWFHPHNFGRETDRNLAFLERLLEHHGRLAAAHGARSRTMAEAAGV